MLINVCVPSSSAINPKLPPCIAKIDHDELVLIEMQGTFDIECGEDSTTDGQFVGKLNLKNTVCEILLSHWRAPDRVEEQTHPYRGAPFTRGQDRNLV